MRRRTVLATAGTALAALTGCGADGPAGSGATGSGSTPSADDGVALADAAVARDLADQPSLGPDPTAAESVVVEVTDPSCPTCRSFHEQAFPRVRSELVDSGKAAFVVRNVDWVYRWAPRASATLEAVHDRASDAYWDLLAFYFGNQGDIGAENVIERTESHLAEAEVDAGAVVDAVAAGEYDDAVAADVAAARDAGADGQPYFFLFKNGTQVTSFRGAQSYDVFASSLGY